MANTKSQARIATQSLGRLFLLGHLPLWAFAIGMVVVTFAVMGQVDQRVRAISAAAGDSPASRAVVEQAGSDFVAVWLTCLASLFIFVLLGSGLVSWTHRVLSQRIARIVRNAELLGSGAAGVRIDAEAGDALGQLETALATVALTIEQRDRGRAAEVARRDQLARLQRALAMVDDETDSYRVVQRGLAQQLPSAAAELLLADSSQAHLRSVVCSRCGDGDKCGVQSPSRCPAVQQGGTLQFDDSEALDACPRLAGRAKPCSAVCVPVTVMGRAVGVLRVTRPRGEDLEPAAIGSLEALIAAFGARAGLLRTLQTTQMQANTDTLTGLLNRRAFEAKALTALASAPRAAMAMADLDHFKRLNDTYGHAAGDKALRSFAQTLRSTLRPSDVVARWGGEEFVVLLPDCTAADAKTALDRVREAVAALGHDGDVPSCTVSFGVAEFPLNDQELAGLLQAADAALYQAKQGGRNRVAIYSGTVTEAAKTDSATA
ncbi:MAG: GGDEF domain-containing protein [Deltaproteobacteria bacterium]|nr:GGDEF domain-containing protein [Deltaproteobacteria bacterium]